MAGVTMKKGDTKYQTLMALMYDLKKERGLEHVLRLKPTEIKRLHPDVFANVDTNSFGNKVREIRSILGKFLLHINNFTFKLISSNISFIHLIILEHDRGGFVDEDDTYVEDGAGTNQQSIGAPLLDPGLTSDAGLDFGLERVEEEDSTPFNLEALVEGNHYGTNECNLSLPYYWFLRFTEPTYPGNGRKLHCHLALHALSGTTTKHGYGAHINEENRREIHIYQTGRASTIFWSTDSANAIFANHEELKKAYCHALPVITKNGTRDHTQKQVVTFPFKIREVWQHWVSQIPFQTEAPREVGGEEKDVESIDVINFTLVVDWHDKMNISYGNSAQAQLVPLTPMKSTMDPPTPGRNCRNNPYHQQQGSDQRSIQTRDTTPRAGTNNGYNLADHFSEISVNESEINSPHHAYDVFSIRDDCGMSAVWEGPAEEQPLFPIDTSSDTEDVSVVYSETTNHKIPSVITTPGRHSENISGSFQQAKNSHHSSVSVNDKERTNNSIDLT